MTGNRYKDEAGRAACEELGVDWPPPKHRLREVAVRAKAILEERRRVEVRSPKEESLERSRQAEATLAKEKAIRAELRAVDVELQSASSAWGRENAKPREELGPEVLADVSAWLRSGAKDEAAAARSLGCKVTELRAAAQKAGYVVADGGAALVGCEAKTVYLSPEECEAAAAAYTDGRPVPGGVTELMAAMLAGK